MLRAGGTRGNPQKLLCQVAQWVPRRRGRRYQYIYEMISSFCNSTSLDPVVPDWRFIPPRSNSNELLQKGKERLASLLVWRRKLRSPNRFHPPDINRFYLGRPTSGEEFDALVLFLRIDHAGDAGPAIVGEDFEH